MPDQMNSLNKDDATLVLNFQEYAEQILSSHERCDELDGDIQSLLFEYLDAYVVNSGEIDDEVCYEVNKLMAKPVREVLPQIMEGRDLIGDLVVIAKDNYGYESLA